MVMRLLDWNLFLLGFNSYDGRRGAVYLNQFTTTCSSHFFMLVASRKKGPE